MADAFADEGIVVIYTTLATGDEARSVARVLVEERLVACANIYAAHQAVYRWQGKVAESEEVGVVLKTSEAKYVEAVERLRVLHPYEIPVICWWGADAIPETLAWITE